MVRRIILLFLALFVFFSVCSTTLAQTDDSSGNIDVRLTRLDETRPYTFMLLVLAAILIVIIATLAVVLKYRFSGSVVRGSHVPKGWGGDEISIRDDSGGSFRDHGYYEEVFRKDILPKAVRDERSVSNHLLDEKNNDVDRYLKEDERIVINVLRMKHNSCSQATLRVVTDFSKARLSRILSELEERGVVYKEQAGRKNIITLKA